MNTIAFIMNRNNSLWHFQQAIERRKKEENATTEGKQQESNACEYQGVNGTRPPAKASGSNSSAHGRKVKAKR
jgi:hypothetical protein